MGQSLSSEAAWEAGVGVVVKVDKIFHDVMVL